jgi:hypothetical protein
VKGIRRERTDLYPESFLVTLNRGAAIIAKSLMWVRKKLQRPTKDLTIFMLVGGCASLIACNLFLPGLMPSGDSMNPRYETSLLPKAHLSRFTLRWFWCNLSNTFSKTLKCSSCVPVCKRMLSMYTRTLLMFLSTVSIKC